MNDIDKIVNEFYDDPSLRELDQQDTGFREARALNGKFKKIRRTRDFVPTKDINSVKYWKDVDREN